MNAQFNRMSDNFGPQIGAFVQGRSFPDRWSRGMKTLGSWVAQARIQAHEQAQNGQLPCLVLYFDFSHPPVGSMQG